jgi:hypothetical protein
VSKNLIEVFRPRLKMNHDRPNCLGHTAGTSGASEKIFRGYSKDIHRGPLSDAAHELPIRFMGARREEFGEVFVGNFVGNFVEPSKRRRRNAGTDRGFPNRFPDPQRVGREKWPDKN